MPKAFGLLKPVALQMVFKKRSNTGAKAIASENLNGRTKFWIVQKPVAEISLHQASLVYSCAMSIRASAGDSRASLANSLSQQSEVHLPGLALTEERSSATPSFYHIDVPKGRPYQADAP